MGVDAFVIRHKSSGVPWQVSRWTDASVINAGDGWHEHPTQALLDCYTIRTALGRTAVSTDCTSPSSATSSTAASPAATCGRSPRSVPMSRSSRRTRCSHRRSKVGQCRRPRRRDRQGRRALHVAHAARADARGAPAEPSRVHGVLRAHPGARRRRKHALVMHPGPMNRGVEMASRSVRAAGLRDHPTGHQRRRVRMAVLFDLLGSGAGSGGAGVTVVIKGGPCSTRPASAAPTS